MREFYLKALLFVPAAWHFGLRLVSLCAGKYPPSIPHSSVEVGKIEECCIPHSGRFFAICIPLTCIPLTCRARPGNRRKKKRPGTDLHEFSINRRENVEENATEASEVSYSTDSSSMNLHYTQILRTNITAKQMDVQGQRKIILSKTLSLPGDMKWEKAIWAILQEHLVFILLPISTQQE